MDEAGKILIQHPHHQHETTRDSRWRFHTCTVGWAPCLLCYFLNCFVFLFFTARFLQDFLKTGSQKWKKTKKSFSTVQGRRRQCHERPHVPINYRRQLYLLLISCLILLCIPTASGLMVPGIFATKMQQNKQYFFSFGEPQMNEQQFNYFGYGQLTIYCSTLKYKLASIATNAKLNSSRIKMDDLHVSIYFSLLILLAGDIQLNPGPHTHWLLLFTIRVVIVHLSCPAAK